MARAGRLRSWLGGLLLGCLFLSQLVLGALIHLDTALARRTLERWVCRALSTELRGSFELGHIEKLTLSNVWLQRVTLYDEQQRRVATLERVRASSDFLPALRRWVMNTQALTLIIESVRADGVRVNLYPDPIDRKPSLLTALEPEPSLATKEPESTQPYRIFLSNVELGDVIVDSTLPDFATNAARLRRLSGQLLFTRDGVAASLRRFSLDIAGPRELPLHAFGTLEYRSPARLWGDINATLGRIPIAARVQYQNDALELAVSAHNIAPTAARELFPDWPLALPLEAALTTHGPVGALGVRLELKAGSTHAEAAGTLSLGTPKRADLSVEARNLDVEALFDQNLPSNVDIAARVTFAMVDDQPRVNVDGVVEAGEFLHFPTPRLDIQGQYDSEGLMFSGRSTDPNLPVRAAAILRNQELDVDAQVSGIDLGRFLPHVDSAPSRGIADARGKARLSKDRISGTLELNLRNLSIGVVRLSQTAVAASFAGPLMNPKAWSGELRLDARRLVAPFSRLDKLALRAQGSAERAKVAFNAEQPGVARLGIAAEVLPLQGPSLRDGRLELERAGRSVSLRVASLAYSEDAIALDGLSLDGAAGHANGSVTLQSGHVFGNLLGQSLDLDVLSTLLGLPSRSLTGRTNLELDVDTRAQPPRGFLRLDLERATIGLLTNVSGNLELGLGAERLTGQATLQSDLIDTIGGSIDVALAGSPLRLSSYEHAQGTASLELSRIRLDRLGTLLGLLGTGPSIAGTANLRFTAERTGAIGLPNLTLSAVTEQLALTLPLATRRIRLQGKDLLLGAAYRADTGQLQSDWVLSQHGQPKATLGFSTTLPTQEQWLEDPGRALADWPNLPFEAFLSFPQQSIAELGETLGLSVGTGDAELKVWLKGPANDARLVTELHGKSLLLEPLGNQVGFDLQGLGEYTQRTGETRVLLAAGSPTKTWLQVNGVGTLATCGRGLPCLRDWDGSVEAGLVDLPLEAMPVLGELGFAGAVRGVVSARRSEGRTQITGVLPIDDFRVSGHPLGQTLLSVHSDQEQLVAGAKLIDGGAQIDLEARLPMEWQSLLPLSRATEPIRFAASATGYDAGFLAPWLDDYVTDLGGELNGSLEAVYTAPAAEESEKTTARLALGGRFGLRRGKATLRAMGFTLTDVELTAQASSTAARTIISIPKFSASAGDETDNLAGAVVIELDGLSLKRLAAAIEKAKNVPLVANSVTVATLTGSANLEMKPETSGYGVGIEVGELEVRLPRSKTREVVGLTEHPDIVVLQPLGPDAWRKGRSSSSTVYRMRLSLGNKTRVTRTDFNLPISGTPEITLGSRVRPSGTIQLDQMGRLQLFGKTFVIERGQVSLDPEQPTNPRLDVTATWRGPTHLVTIQIQGKADEARLRLSSDPALSSESQIMALLLGGSSAKDSSAAAGLGVGATLFNEMLSDTALSRLEVRTSSDERHANYTAAVPIRENLWFEATYQSPTNTNMPGSSTQKGFSGTVDYRFHRDWSVRTEVGTLGAGADLMWQYRY